MSGGEESLVNFGRELPRPAKSSTEAKVYSWALVARNKKVLNGWRGLCEQLHENAVRCYDWLRTDPTRRIPGRCYALKHKRYAGAWAYEIGSGQRIYYKLRHATREVLVYYAGPHPPAAPYPPSE